MQPIPPPGRLIDIGGRSLHASIAGTGGPLVVLEAGIAATSLSWALVTPNLSRFATVITYDRAGLGWSDPATHRCTARDAAADLGLLLTRLGVEGPITMCGHSFGGLIVRVFEEMNPGRIRALVLADPVVRAEWRRMTPRLARGVTLSRRGALLARLGVVRFGLGMLTSGSRRIPKLMARVSAGRGAQVTERLTGEVRKMPAELWPAIAWHWSQAKSFRAMGDALENLPVSVGQIDENRSLGDLPMAVLSAASSPAEALREHRHDAELSSRGEHIVISGAGHWMQLDAPEAIADAIRRVSGRSGCQ